MLAYLLTGATATSAADAAGEGAEPKVGEGKSKYNWALMGGEGEERGKEALMGEALIGGVLM